MVVETPFENPDAYDAITLDNVDTPGLCTLAGGGDRKSKWEAQQAPGFAGAFSVYRGEEVPTLDYEVHVWTNEEYKALQALAVRLQAARKARKVMTLVDLAIAHNEIAQVNVAMVGAIKQGGKAKARFHLPFGFSEWRKRQPVGGAARPKTPEERANEALNEQNKALRAQAEAAEKAAGLDK